jgi:hypothetical protein
MRIGLKTVSGLGLCLAGAGALALWCASCSSESTANSSRGTSGKQAVSRGKGPDKAAEEFGADFEKIRIEAESAAKIEGDLMRIIADPQASGGKCIEIPDKLGKPEDGKFARAIYRFTVAKAGHYTFWCRRWWLDQCGDTFAVRFDEAGKPRKLGHEPIIGSDNAARFKQWGWSPVFENGKPRQWYFTAGPHVMEILNTEDGPRLDLILLTNDRDYLPSDSEEMPEAR